MIISELLEGGTTKNGEFRLAHGALQACARKFNCHHGTIGKIWKRACASRADPNIQAYRATPQKKGNSGRRQIYDREALAEALSALPIRKRRTLRAMAKRLGLSKSTLHRMVGEDDKFILPHTNKLKPTLTEENKLTRLAYAALEVESPDGGNSYVFHDGDNVVHIDEKWFWVTEECLRYYLAKGEVPQARHVKHKSHILKVMFLAATARPRFDAQGNCTFDGKIGIWPFVERVQAQRSSNRRAAGTWETKPINVDKNTYKQFVLEKVIPAIKEKWPRSNGFRCETVRLQHDNATSHFDEADEDWVDCCFQN